MKIYKKTIPDPSKKWVVDANRLSVNTLLPAVPVFIGYTEFDGVNHGTAGDDALHQLPVFIDSLLEFERVFGGPQPEENMVLRVSPAGDSAELSARNGRWSRHILYYALQLFFANGGNSCYVVSAGLFNKYPGKISKTLLWEAAGSIPDLNRPLIIVVPEATRLPSESSCYRFAGDMIDWCAGRGDSFYLFDIYRKSLDTINVSADVEHFRNAFTHTKNLGYTAVYYPWLATSVNLLPAPLATVYPARSRKPVKLEMLKSAPIYPVLLNAIAAAGMTLPPAAAIAGLWMYTDNILGVWKAPVSVALQLVVDTAAINDQENSQMNVDVVGGKSVNAIRYFTGKGRLAWGARTLAGNDNEWRYIPVRRTMIMIETTLRRSLLQWAGLQITAENCMRMRVAIEEYLFSLWKSGALQGEKPELAYYVRLGEGITMTQADADSGNLVIELGIALLRPAEFNLLRLHQKMS